MLLSWAGWLAIAQALRFTYSHINHGGNDGRVSLAACYLRVHVGQTVSSELVKQPPVLEMLHDHSDELWVSWWEVAAPVPLRHNNPPELFAGRLTNLVSYIKSSYLGLKFAIALLFSC